MGAAAIYGVGAGSIPKSIGGSSMYQSSKASLKRQRGKKWICQQ